MSDDAQLLRLDFARRRFGQVSLTLLDEKKPQGFLFVAKLTSDFFVGRTRDAQLGELVDTLSLEEDADALDKDEQTIALTRDMLSRFVACDLEFDSGVVSRYVQEARTPAAAGATRWTFRLRAKFNDTSPVVTS